ncbi:hypothetical protein A2W14_02020 [Candidatus Gottesmanbacteria bacterium RBG_16_37_8]|uniref:Phosphatidic acid phosphatase type 2/haloperoxidase domain-containing protein n=1 Tax=Candidatus Gottesmanbacteria bacterium RBG_16_37_8 TaxID=1798371 RepID=A0A1F5YRY2_9BACT|nr:MAG: hypothetical protein A2W14_02020 [Candidatus Gottesmanbacteria bacterium RBG_16_37_8]
MLDIIFSADRQILLIINHLPHNFFTDSFFLFFSFAGYYGVIWFVITVLLFLFDGLDNRREVTALFITVLSEIFLVEIFLKNLFLRIRPETAIGDNLVKLLGPTASYSFPSGHATIAFAAAYILSRQRPKLTIFLFFLAVIVAVSRIYLGKHYPSDVIAGAVLGMLIGIMSSHLVWKSFPEKKVNLKK